MAKKRSKRRSAFPPAHEESRRKRERERNVMPELNERINADEITGGVFGFFRDIGVRETIESIIVAIVLALMFRAYEAEAFIIPTGSMAPSLQGQHMDLHCENCGIKYRSGASYESSASSDYARIESTYCPVCQYRTRMSRGKEPDHISNNGDRILVNKFIYDFQEPERYDVIVFKNPNIAKQNYIKRLIGLPGDNILIENGDIYLMDKRQDGTWSKRISRKPPRKLRHILQAVDDTNHIGKYLIEAGWPSRWQSFDGTGNWEIKTGVNSATFASEPSQETNWLRYRHFRPLKSDWATLSGGLLPERYKGGNLPTGSLIDDLYGYNEGVYEQLRRNSYSLHWVGDLGVEAEVEVQTESGVLSLDVVEGGAHFICDIDVATGVATLRCNDKNVETKVTFEDVDGNDVEAPQGQTNLKGPGSYKIEYVNADDRIHLWINNKLIEFDAATYRRTGIPIPTYTKEDPADAEPAGIATTNLGVVVNRLRVLRDIYYTSAKGFSYSPLGRPSPAENETGVDDWMAIELLQMNPEAWSNTDSIAFFKIKKGQTEPMFQLERGATSDKDQFLPMGDNSPRSSDGRVWNGPNYVERDLLIGRALIIYWPHTKNRPIKYFPNFEEMGFIR